MAIWQPTEAALQQLAFCQEEGIAEDEREAILMSIEDAPRLDLDPPQATAVGGRRPPRVTSTRPNGRGVSARRARRIGKASGKASARTWSRGCSCAPRDWKIGFGRV